MTSTTPAPSNAAGSETPSTGAGSTPPGEGAASLFNATLVTGCEAVVSSYRAQRIDKAQAILDLLEVIDIPGGDTPTERTSRTNTYRTFLGQFDEIDAGRRQAGDRGATSAPASQPQVHFADSADTSGAAGSEHGGDDLPPDVDDPEDVPRAAKRKRTSSNESSSAKIPLDESLLPFMPGNRVAIAIQGKDPLEATLFLKENYLRDVALVKQRILCRPDCPEVPELVWNGIISSKYVDFDHIFSSIFSVDGDSKDTFHFGDVELSTASTKPTKKVKSQGDWISCWNRYYDAVVYVYPCRDIELRTYSTYVNDTFVGLRDDCAPQVVLFDRGARVVAARGNRGSLSDAFKLQYLQIMYLHPSGAAAPGVVARAEGSRSRGRSNDVCNKYNDGKCPNRDCRYKHACRSCGGSHAQTDCPTGKSGGAPEGKRK